MKETEIETLASIRVKYADDYYKIVDLLNRTLKEERLMFGLSLDKKNPSIGIFTIYRTN
jgi:hypothetical protein